MRHAAVTPLWAPIALAYVLRSYPGLGPDQATPFIVNNTGTEPSIGEHHLLIDWQSALNASFIKGLARAGGVAVQGSVRFGPMHRAGEEDRTGLLKRLYGEGYSFEQDPRGTAVATVYHIYDDSPVYEPRQTTKGKRAVNVHMFDLKSQLRQLLADRGGPLAVHATDNIQETRDNLKAVGVLYRPRVFQSLSEALTALETAGVPYVVLRNFEGYPDSIALDEHTDVDLLVLDYHKAKAVLDGHAAEAEHRLEDGGFRVRNLVQLGHVKVSFDLRYVGDGYYDQHWQTDMLASRVYEAEKRFYRPSDEHHLYSLIYHALVHKPVVSDTYLRVFRAYGLLDRDLTREGMAALLQQWMTAKGYTMKRPQDLSVGCYPL